MRAFLTLGLLVPGISSAGTWGAELVSPHPWSDCDASAQAWMSQWTGIEMDVDGSGAITGYRLTNASTTYPLTFDDWVSGADPASGGPIQARFTDPGTNLYEAFIDIYYGNYDNTNTGMPSNAPEAAAYDHIEPSFGYSGDSGHYCWFYTQNFTGDGAGGPTCVVGAPHDWDGDLTDDGCLDALADIDPSATIATGAQIGQVTIGAGASIGADTLVRDGAFVAPHAILGSGNDIGEDSVIGRSATIGDDNTFGHDAIVGRTAQVGDGNVLSGLVQIGYGATVGSHVTVSTALQMANLAALGGPATGTPAIQCGGLTIGRASQVAVGAPYTLTCTSSTRIGPDTTVGSGSTLGDTTAIRKASTFGTGLTLGTGATVGRGADFGDGVTVGATVTVGASAHVCDGTVVSASQGRDYEDPACP